MRYVEVVRVKLKIEGTARETEDDKNYEDKDG